MNGFEVEVWGQRGNRVEGKTRTLEWVEGRFCTKAIKIVSDIAVIRITTNDTMP